MTTLADTVLPIGQSDLTFLAESFVRIDGILLGPRDMVGGGPARWTRSTISTFTSYDTLQHEIIDPVPSSGVENPIY